MRGKRLGVLAEGPGASGVVRSGGGNNLDGTYSASVGYPLGEGPVVSVDVAGVYEGPVKSDGSWRWVVALIALVLIAAAIRQCWKGCRWCRADEESIAEDEPPRTSQDS